MKNLFTLLLVLFSIPAIGQMFFDAGVKAGYGYTFLYNQNQYDFSPYSVQLTGGSAFGAKLGINLNQNHAFNLEYMRGSSHQKLEFDNGNNTDVHQYDWNHNDFLLLYRLSGRGVFAELGPKFSSVNDMTLSEGASDAADVSPFFTDNYTSAVFGFGGFLAGNDVLTIQLSVRLAWALNDFVTEEGMDANYPSPRREPYNEYKKTRPAAAQIQLELNYAFGRFAKASCQDRNKLILFQ